MLQYVGYFIKTEGRVVVMNKRFLIIMALFVAVFIGLIVVNKKDTVTPTNVEQNTTNHTYGNGKKGVTLVEYGDFQCPACQNYYYIVKQIKAKFKDQIIFQFRHFPIVSAHQNAMVAARAAEAASNQGKFWEMHDLLYENQKNWESSSSAVKIFEGYAASLSLDIVRFRQDAASEDTNAKIQADFKSGEGVGVKGTPTFEIDGKIIENPQSLEAFEKLIEDAIKAKSTS